MSPVPFASFCPELYTAAIWRHNFDHDGGAIGREGYSITIRVPV
jgi:hypothetical protein